jgi:enamine deaminase RidA (YjgF/YER057c/UK114 family)
MTLTKQVFRSGPYADLIAQGVKVGNILYLSGQVGMDEAGNIPTTMTEQTVLAYANIRAVLAEFGAGLDNIVDETFLVTSVEETHENLKAIYGARAEAYGRTPEVTQTLIGVVGLVLPKLKLEIKCIAHL